MQAVLLKSAFDIDRLTLEEQSRPTAGESEILVRMQAASLNYVDLAVVSGKLDPNISLSFIPVADGSGVVEEVGKNVNAFTVGDRVATVYIPSWTGGRYRQRHTALAIRPGAGQVPGQLVEFKVFRADELIQVPDFMSFEEAATLPIAGLTAWNALCYAGIEAGDTILLHGTGGVSLFSLQFAKVFGARTIITSSDDQKLGRAKALGADYVINYKTHPNLSDEVLRITDREGVDIVVETVGGPNLNESLKSLKPEGHVSVVGFLAGVEANINLISLNLKRSTITGISVGSMDDYRDMLEAMSVNLIKPVIDSIFPLKDSVKAFRRLESGKHFGKIVIDLA